MKYKLVPRKNPQKRNDPPEFYAEPTYPGVGIPMRVAEWNEIQWSGSRSSGSSNYVIIDQRTLQGYYERIKKASRYSYYNIWETYLPFDYYNYRDNRENLSIHLGVRLNTGVAPPTMTGSYKLWVQETENKVNPYWTYCEDLTQDDYTNWRLPTSIEVYTIWDKCKGTSLNRQPTASSHTYPNILPIQDPPLYKWI